MHRRRSRSGYIVRVWPDNIFGDLNIARASRPLITARPLQNPSYAPVKHTLTGEQKNWQYPYKMNHLRRLFFFSFFLPFSLSLSLSLFPIAYAADSQTVAPSRIGSFCVKKVMQHLHILRHSAIPGYIILLKNLIRWWNRLDIHKISNIIHKTLTTGRVPSKRDAVKRGIRNNGIAE